MQKEKYAKYALSVFCFVFLCFFIVILFKNYSDFHQNIFSISGVIMGVEGDKITLKEMNKDILRETSLEDPDGQKKFLQDPVLVTTVSRTRYDQIKQQDIRAGQSVRIEAEKNLFSDGYEAVSVGNMPMEEWVALISEVSFWGTIRSVDGNTFSITIEEKEKKALGTFLGFDSHGEKVFPVSEEVQYIGISRENVVSGKKLLFGLKKSESVVNKYEVFVVWDASKKDKPNN